LPLVTQDGFRHHVKKAPAWIRPKKDASLILGCFRGGVVSLQPYWNEWIVLDIWVDIINSMYNIPDNLRFTSKELIASVARNKVYKSNNIETTKMVNPYKVKTKTINERWNGKPKGMLQILWERGFIDPIIEPLKAEGFYTNNGKKDAF
jgi:hypothetical protein